MFRLYILFVFQNIVKQMSLHRHVDTGLKDIALLVDYHAEGYSREIEQGMQAAPVISVHKYVLATYLFLS